MNIYTEPQQLIDPKKLIKLLKDIDDNHAKTYGEHCLIRLILSKVDK